jgi:hypothetical protein
MVMMMMMNLGLSLVVVGGCHVVGRVLVAARTKQEKKDQKNDACGF